MANLCSSEITFYSQNRKQISSFLRRLQEIFYEKPKYDNAFGASWMGNYADAFYPEIGADNIDCRGSIEIMDESIRCVEKYFAFSLFAGTANSAKIGLWYKILQDFYPDVKLAYIAEESSNSYFVKWDETGLFYPYDFYMDIAYPDDKADVAYLEDHEFGSMKEIYDWLDSNVPFEYEKKDTADDLDWEIRSKLDEYNSDEFFCNIAEYMKIAPSEFDFKINRR